MSNPYAGFSPSCTDLSSCTLPIGYAWCRLMSMCSLGAVTAEPVPTTLFYYPPGSSDVAQPALQCALPSLDVLSWPVHAMDFHVRPQKYASCLALLFISQLPCQLPSVVSLVCNWRHHQHEGCCAEAIKRYMITFQTLQFNCFTTFSVCLESNTADCLQHCNVCC